jgi:hypothetical protein
MAEQKPDSRQPVHTAHNYGQITVGIEGMKPASVSDEQIQHVLQIILRRIQDSVVPDVEHIVEEERIHIGDETVHVENDLPLLPDGNLIVHIDCEVVPEISDAAIAEVDHLIEAELKPWKGSLSPRPKLLPPSRVREDEIRARERIIKAVRSVIGGDLRGRGG